MRSCRVPGVYPVLCTYPWERDVATESMTPSKERIDNTADNMLFTIRLFIYSFIFLVAMATIWEAQSGLLYLWPQSPAPPEGSPSMQWDTVSSAGLGSPSSGACLIQLQQESTRGILVKCPNATKCFLSIKRSSEDLLECQAPHLNHS